MTPVAIEHRSESRAFANGHVCDQNSATGPVLQGGGSEGVQSALLTESCPYGKGGAPCCLKSWLAVVRYSAGLKTTSEHALMYQIL